MSDLEVLLDRRKFEIQALSTIKKEDLKLMNHRERMELMIDINKTRDKALNYLGYERFQDEKGIWHISENTKPEQDEIDKHDKWLQDYYEEMDKHFDE